MDESDVSQLFQLIESKRQTQEGVECWSSRDLLELLGYNPKKWADFRDVVIKKAIEACKHNDHNPAEHFVFVEGVTRTGVGDKPKDDCIVTRYAGYLIAINGNPKFPQVAFAQQYFVESTRKFELIAQRVLHESAVDQERLELRKRFTYHFKDFTAVLKDHGIDGIQYGKVISKGDEALFNGFSTRQMKARYGIPNTKPLPDAAPDIINSAREFANQMSKENIEKKNINGEFMITREHQQNNLRVRQAMTEGGIIPEDLPAAEDTKVIERRAALALRHLVTTTPRKTIAIKKKLISEDSPKSTIDPGEQQLLPFD